MNVTHLIHINRNDQITVQIGKELKAIFEMNKAIQQMTISCRKLKVGNNHNGPALVHAFLLEMVC